MITTKDLYKYLVGIKKAGEGDLRLMPQALEVETETCVLLCIPKSQMEKWEQEVQE